MWPPQQRNGNSNQVRFGENNCCLNHFWLHKTCDFLCMCQHLKRIKSIPDRSTSTYSTAYYAFAVKGFCALFSAFEILSWLVQELWKTWPLRQGQAESCFMATVSTVLSTLCKDTESFACNLPNSARHMTRPNQGLSTDTRENLGMWLEKGRFHKK